MRSFEGGGRQWPGTEAAAAREHETGAGTPGHHRQGHKYPGQSGFPTVSRRGSVSLLCNLRTNGAEYQQLHPPQHQPQYWRCHGELPGDADARWTMDARGRGGMRIRASSWEVHRTRGTGGWAPDARAGGGMKEGGAPASTSTVSPPHTAVLQETPPPPGPT